MRCAAKVTMYVAIGIYDRAREVMGELVKRGEQIQHEIESRRTAMSHREHGQEHGHEHEHEHAGMQDRVGHAVSNMVEKIPRPASAREVAALEERVRALEARAESVHHEPIVP